MKKPNRSMGFDEKPDPSQEADIDLESLGEDDDEIIDLEDIIEMPAGSIDEDEDIDLDVEILDAEPDLDFDDFEPTKEGEQLSFGKKPAAAPSEPSEAEDVDVDDLLKDIEGEDDLFGTAAEAKEPELDQAEILGETEELDKEEPAAEAAEPIMAEEPAVVEKSSGEPALDEEEDELLKSLLDELDGIQEAAKPAEPPPLRERAAAALKIDDETDRASEIPPDISIPEEAIAAEEMIEAVPEVEAIEAAPAPVAEVPEAEAPGIPELPETEAPVAPEAFEAEPAAQPKEEAPKISEAAVLQQTKIPSPEIASAAAADVGAAEVERPRRQAPEAPKPSSPRPVLESEPAIVVATGNDALIAELIEELVGRIEFRLLDTVRQVVEAKLPGIAREIIREEIERLKKEID